MMQLQCDNFHCLAVIRDNTRQEVDEVYLGAPERNLREKLSLAVGNIVSPVSSITSSSLVSNFSVSVKLS